MKHVLFGLALGALAASAVHADSGFNLGVLTCKLKGVTNDIVYSKEEFACDYKPKSGDPQSYTGQITSIGLDLKVTREMTLVWAVAAPTSDPLQKDALKGKYVGGGAAVALGAGGGADVLIGGNNNSFTLQPLSASGIVGAGASLGIEEFVLR